MNSGAIEGINIVEEVVEEEEEEPVEEEPVAAPKKKTGAQKRKEKKEREAAEKKEAAKSVKKSETSSKKKAPEKPKQKVVEDEWNVVSDDKKVKGNNFTQKSEPAAEEASKPAKSDKQKKKEAKARAEKQRENAKKKAGAFDNMPEDMKAQLQAQVAKFNPEPVTAVVLNDEWTDIAVKPTKQPKKSVTAEPEQTEEADAEAAPKKTRAPKPTIYKNASQSEIFKPVGERRDDEFSKVSFKGLEASW